VLKLQRFCQILVPALLAGCVSDATLPELGPCSVTPTTDLWEFGQVGIGTCLSSPSDLQIRPDPQDPDNYFIVAVNSNGYSNFSGSSVLTIDASSIDLTCPLNGMHEVEAFALGMQEFAGRLAVDEARGLGLLSSRVNGQFDGDLTDVVFTLDMSDPRAMSFSDAGPHSWGPFRWVQVSADPWSVRINPWDGRAYVLGLTNHTVAALDLVSDPIQFVDLVGDLSITSAEFTDVDGSGSAPDFTLGSIVPGELRNELLTLTFQEGTTRLFFAQEDGAGLSELHASNSGDGVSFVPLAGGPIVDADADWAVGGVDGGAIGFFGDGLAGLLAGTDAAGVRRLGRMSAADNALDWTVAATAVLDPSSEPSAWDSAGVFDPDWLDSGSIVDVWYSGGPGWGTAIGHAEGSSFSSLSKVGDETLPGGVDGQVLAPDAGSWDSGAVFAPAVITDGLTGRLHLYYSGHDGQAVGDLDGATAIGLATSTDGGTFVRTDRGDGGTSAILEPGENGAWDGLAVGWPTVFFDNGRWQMWYRGTDGVTWQIGRATSVDGFNWTRDPRNPVAGEGFEVPVTGAPVRVFAQKVSPRTGYQISGEISGDVPSLAFEGVAYANTVSPLGFVVVGGQALGRGPAGSYDRDGAASASRLPGSDLVFYQAWRGTRSVLAAGKDLGAGAQRLDAVTAQGWTGALDGLNGDSPSIALHEPDARADATGAVVAFSTSSGIAIGHVSVTGDVLGDLEPLAEGVVLSASADDTRFDSAGVSSPSLLLDGHDGATRLAYEGARGDVTAIGIATAPGVGQPFTTTVEPAFPRGPAGTWDDASVASPSLLWDEEAGLYKLWYLGSDGATFRVGYATSADAVTWDRTADADGVTQPVFEPGGLAFLGEDGLSTLRVRSVDNGRYEMWFDGQLEGIPRVGRAVSEDGVSWSTLENPTTAGDTFSVTTREGDSDASTAIHLGEPSRQGETEDDVTLVGGFRVHGAGATEMILSPDGRFGVVSNKRTDYVLVLDLQDDSTEDWVDANAFGIEAAFRIPQRFGTVGTRDMEFSPDGTRLHVTVAPQILIESSEPSFRTGTEAFVTLDWTLVEDTDEGTLLLDDVLLSWAPLARGSEEDEGYTADTSVASNAFVLSADGTRAYVANYNDNSMWIIALDTGARGTVIEMVQGLDEAPSEIVLSPDGKLAYVANYLGQTRNQVVHSTIQVIDVDEASPTFGDVVTRLSNISERSERGCE